MESSLEDPSPATLRMAGKQDEVSTSYPGPFIARKAALLLPRPVLAFTQVLKLRAALNDKEMELLELREQHMQLVVRTIDIPASPWHVTLIASVCCLEAAPAAASL